MTFAELLSKRCTMLGSEGESARLSLTEASPLAAQKIVVTQKTRLKMLCKNENMKYENKI